MKFLTSALLGLFGAAGLIVLSVFTLLRPVIWPTAKTTGLPTEYLAHGASEWRVIPPPPSPDPARLFALPGNAIAAWTLGDQAAVLDPSTFVWKMTPMTVEEPLRWKQGGPTSTFWSALSPTEALAAYYDDYATGAKSDQCQLWLEPKHEPLPKLPPACEKAFGGARLTSGAYLALAWDGAAKTSHTFHLAPDAKAWTDVGELPEKGNGELVAGANERAIYAGYTDRVALFEGGAWKVLPKNVSPRYAYKFALADDGAVLIVGGQQDENAGKSAIFALLPLLALGGLVALGIVARVKWKASVGGMLLGVIAAFMLAAIAFLALLPSLAWH